MFGQDWQPVILKNPGLTKKTSKQHDKTHAIDSESNELSHNKVGICIGKQIDLLNSFSI